MIRIRLFGTTEVLDLERDTPVTDFRGNKARQILAILALHPGQRMAKTRLAKLLWDDRVPDSWHSTLEGYVSLLRRSLEPGVRPTASMISTQRGSYCLLADRVSTDLAEFDSLVTRANTMPPAEALPHLLAALELARSEVLADEQWTWAAEVRERYRHKVVKTHVRAGRHALALRDSETAADLGQRGCDLNPLDEEAWNLVIAAHWFGGRRSEGLRSFATLRATLANELGIAPGRRAQRLHLMIVQDEPTEAHVRDAELELLLAGEAPAHATALR